MKIEMVIDPRHATNTNNSLAARVAQPPKAAAGGEAKTGRSVAVFSWQCTRAQWFSYFSGNGGRGRGRGRGGNKGGNRAPKTAADLDAEMEVSAPHVLLNCSLIFSHKDYTASTTEAAAPAAAPAAAA
jgi:hypothetical protein